MIASRERGPAIGVPANARKIQPELAERRRWTEFHEQPAHVPKQRNVFQSTCAAAKGVKLNQRRCDLLLKFKKAFQLGNRLSVYLRISS